MLFEVDIIPPTLIRWDGGEIMESIELDRQDISRLMKDLNSYKVHQIPNIL